MWSRDAIRVRSTLTAVVPLPRNSCERRRIPRRAWLTSIRGIALAPTLSTCSCVTCNVLQQLLLHLLDHFVHKPCCHQADIRPLPTPQPPPVRAHIHTYTHTNTQMELLKADHEMREKAQTCDDVRGTAPPPPHTHARAPTSLRLPTGPQRARAPLSRVTNTQRELWEADEDMREQAKMLDPDTAEYMLVSEIPVWEPERGPLSQRISRTMLEEQTSDEISVLETGYWFHTPPGEYLWGNRLG